MATHVIDDPLGVSETRKTLGYTSNPLSRFRWFDCVDVIQTYINYCWVFCFSPVYVSPQGRNFKLYHFGIHRVFCGILHFLTIVNAILEIHKAYDEPIEIQPRVVFNVAERVASAFSPLVFYYKLWFRKEEVLALIEVLASNMSKRAKHLSKPVLLICILRLGFSSLYVATKYLNIFQQRFLVKPGIFEFAASETLFKLYITDHRSYRVGPFEQLPFCAQMLTYLNMILTGYYSLFLDTVSMLALLSSVVAYMITSEFDDFLKCSLDKDRHCDRANMWIPRKWLLMQRYYEMKQKLHCLNKLVGPVFLVVFCSQIAFFSGIGISSLFIYGSYFYLGELSVYIVIFVATLILAAEANRKANHFKEWFLLEGRGDSVQDIFEYFRISSDQLGIKGGRFFIVTYGLLGTTFSVLLTYSIIMIDFTRITVLSNANATFPQTEEM